MVARVPFTSHDKAAEFEIQSLLNATAAKQGLFCLSPSTWELAYNLVLFYSRWRSRYYYTDPATGDQLTITDDEFDLVIDAVDLALEELQMSGCEELANAINNVALALAAKGDCGSEVTNVEVVCVPVDQLNPDGTDTAPPIDGNFDPWTETYPDGFDSLEDYLQYKCQAANFIFDALVKFFRTMSGLTVVNTVAAEIATYLGVVALGIFLTPLSWVALVGAFLAIAALGVGTWTFLNNIADALEANRDDIVCSLYVAQNTLNAINSTIDQVEDAIEAGLLSAGIGGAVGTALAAILGEIAATVINNDLMNNLFQLGVNVAYAGADCSTCFPDTSWQIPLDYHLGIRANPDTLWGVARVGDGPLFMQSGTGPHTINSVPGYNATTGAATGLHYVAVMWTPYAEAEYGQTGTLPTGGDGTVYQPILPITLVTQPVGRLHARQVAAGVIATAGPYGLTTYTDQLAIYWQHTAPFAIELSIG